MTTLTYYDNAAKETDMVDLLKEWLYDISEQPIPTDEEFPIQYKITVTIEEIK